MRLLLLAAGILAATACDITVGPAHLVTGSGNVKTESRSVSGFDRVDLAGIGSLVMTQGGTDALRITADDNLLPLLRSDVVSGTLELAPKENTSIRPSTTIRYELTFKQVHGVSLAGSGDMRSDALSADQLALRLAGSGNARIVKLTADALTVTLAGSGGVELAGTVSKQTVEISGSGTYTAGDLASRQATVNISGSGDCRVRVSDSLTARVMGSGSIKYSGSPVVNQQVLGSGSITRTG